MKTRIILFSCLLLVAGQFGLASADGSGWSGLWKLVQQTESGPVTLYCLLKSKEDHPTLYSSEWLELPLSDSKLQGNSIMVNWQAKGGNLIFRGVRGGASMTGDWEFLHPQYRLEGKFSASRIAVSPDWSPLAGIEELNPNESGFVDLNELLIKAAGEGDFATFWRTKFLPKYYPFLSEAPSPAEIERIVTSAAFRSKAKAFHENVLEHLKRAKEKTSGVAFPMPIVGLCFGREARLAFVGSRVFVVANAKEFAGADTAGDMTRSAELLISVELANSISAAPGLPLDFFRRGVPLLMAAKLAYSDKIEDILQVSAERGEQLKNELPELKKKVLSKKALTEEERRFLAFDFVSGLAADHSITTLLRLKPLDVGKAFRAYILGPEAVKSDPPNPGGSA